MGRTNSATAPANASNTLDSRYDRALENYQTNLHAVETTYSQPIGKTHKQIAKLHTAHEALSDLLSKVTQLKSEKPEDDMTSLLIDVLENTNTLLHSTDKNYADNLAKYQTTADLMSKQTNNKTMKTIGGAMLALSLVAAIVVMTVLAAPLSAALVGAGGLGVSLYYSFFKPSPFVNAMKTAANSCKDPDVRLLDPASPTA